VKIVHRSGVGRGGLLTLLGASDVFGILSMFEPGPRTASAVAVTAVGTMVLDRHALQQCIAERPQLSEHLLSVLARRLRRANKTVDDLVFSDVPGPDSQAATPPGRTVRGTARPSTSSIPNG
jgi:CRP/FNR family transcriptional regulator, cyclic AMP receptor protein